MTCQQCIDPDGEACFPVYGLGPHTHDSTGKTIMEQDQAWPGFTPDPDCPGMGVHWCPSCGEGKPA